MKDMLCICKETSLGTVVEREGCLVSLFDSKMRRHTANYIGHQKSQLSEKMEKLLYGRYIYLPITVALAAKAGHRFHTVQSRPAKRLDVESRSAWLDKILSSI